MSPSGAVLTVLATTDLHGFRIPTAQLSEAAGDTLLVDNGDLLGGEASLIDPETTDCPLIEGLNRAGVVCAGVGNHDLDQGVAGLLARQRQARFPLVSANLRVGEELLVEDRVVLETPGGPVGITGAISAMAPFLWPPALRGQLRVTDPVDALVQVCRALRPRCQWVVVLAHLGFRLADIGERLPGMPAENPGETLVEALGQESRAGVPLADVVVLGHTHVEQARVSGRTAVVLPGSRGQVLGRVRLRPPDPPQAELLPVSGATLQPGFCDRSRPMPGAECATFGEQLRRAARQTGAADGLIVTRRAGASGPPAMTLGEALDRLPVAEPLLLLELPDRDLQSIRQRSEDHAAAALCASDPVAVRRHRWHALEIIGAASGRSQSRLLVPASWSAGYGGYPELARAPLLAEPGISLISLLLKAD